MFGISQLDKAVQPILNKKPQVTPSGGLPTKGTIQEEQSKPVQTPSSIPKVGVQPTNIGFQAPKIQPLMSQATPTQQTMKVEGIDQGKPQGKFFTNITLDQENVLRSRLKQQFPDMTGEQRKNKAQEIVMGWEKQGKVKPLLTQQDQQPQEQQSKGFIQSIGEKWKQRTSDIGQSLTQGTQTKEQAQEEIKKQVLGISNPIGFVKNLIDESISGKQGITSTSTQTLGNVFGYLNDVVNEAGARVLPKAIESMKFGLKSNPITAPLYKINELALNKIGELTKTSEGQEVVKKGMGLMQEGGKKLEEFKKNYPVAYKNIMGVKDILEGVGNIVGGQQLYKAGKNAIPGAIEEIKQTGQGIKESVKGLIPKSTVKGVTQEQALKSLEKSIVSKTKQGKKILDMISEPETPGNIKLATDQNRILSESQSSLGKNIFGKKKSNILPDENTIRAQNVIQKEIKDLSDDPFKAITQIKSKNTQMAKELAPELQKMPIGTMTKWKKNVKESVKQVVDNTNIPFDIDEKKSFKEFIKQLDNSKNADDVWKARQTYDMLTPKSIKNYTGQPYDKWAEFQQKIWLKTRSEMNKALDGIAQSYGKKDVLDKFKDMSSLYEATENMINKAPQTFKSTEGLLNKKNMLRGAIGGGLTTIGLGKLTGSF